MVRFDKIAKECRETAKGPFVDVPIVGLEHIEPYDMLLKNWDVNVETTFTKIFKKGQILFGRRRAYQHKACVATCDGICSGDITVIEPIVGAVCSDLLPFIVQNDDFFEHAIKGSNGALSPRVKWEHMASFEIKLPSIEQQKALGDKLWAAYEVKQSYLRMIEATEKMVKSQFIEMFDFEYNSHNWPILRFSDFASLDCTMTSDYDKYADYPHIGIDSIEQNTGKLFGYRTVKEDNVKSGKYIFTSNHIIYSKIRPNLNKVATPNFDGLCSADAYPILATERKTSKTFLAYLMRSDVFLRYVVPLSNRTGMPKVNREQVESFSCPFPPKSEQGKFVLIYNQADKSENVIRKSIEVIDQEIKSLINENL